MIGKIINKFLKPFNYYVAKSNSNEGSLSFYDGWDFLFQDLRKKGITCNVILDLGANDAKWSENFLKYYPEAKVMLVEPQLEFAPILEKFCANNIGSKYLPYGVGDVSENMILTVWDDLKGSSFLPKKDKTSLDSGKQRVIQVETIDNLLGSGRLEYPDFVKMDIQGFELKALTGGQLLFERTHLFFIECSLQNADDTPNQPLLSEVIEFMKMKSFVPYDFPGFLRRPSDNSMAQCDICFVRIDSKLRANHSWK